MRELYPCPRQGHGSAHTRAPGHRPTHPAPVAQWIEQAPSKRLAAGSSPAGGASLRPPLWEGFLLVKACFDSRHGEPDRLQAITERVRRCPSVTGFLRVAVSHTCRSSRRPVRGSAAWCGSVSPVLSPVRTRSKSWRSPRRKATTGLPEGPSAGTASVLALSRPRRGVTQAGSADAVPGVRRTPDASPREVLRLSARPVPVGELSCSCPRAYVQPFGRRVRRRAQLIRSIAGCSQHALDNGDPCTPDVPPSLLPWPSWQRSAHRS